MFLNYKKKGSKYKNIKTKDGFDSKKEKKRFLELEIMQKAGVIKCLLLIIPMVALSISKYMVGKKNLSKLKKCNVI